MGERDDLEAENLELVRRHYVAFRERDLDSVLSGLSPDVEIAVNDQHGAPETQTRRGLDAAREFFSDVFGSVTEPTVEIQEIRSDSHKVLVSIELGGTLRDSGRSGTISAVHLFTLHEGLITSIRTHRPDWRAPIS